MPWISRGRLAAMRARIEQLTEQRDEARQDAAAHLGAAKRTAGYSTTVSREIYAARNALAAANRRADRLQQRLDSALGLDSPAIADGALWQQHRTDKPKPGPSGVTP